MSAPSPSAHPTIPPEQFDLWEDAYTAVESYLLALRIRNRLVLAELVRRILFRAAERQREQPGKLPREIVIELAMEEVSAWTSEVLGQPLEHGRLDVRGRLALLLANMPGKWQSVFLAPPPWPEEFVKTMRASYLDAAPRFAELTMAPNPLELNPIGSGAAVWYETMGRQPILRRMSALAALVLLCAALWFLFL